MIIPGRIKQNLFSDLHKDLSTNPMTSDLALKKDEEAVKESVKNLILTDKGERLMKPLLGGNIRSMLFENNTPATIKLIQEQIRYTINEYEPRVDIIDIVVSSNIDETTINVTIHFYLNNMEQPITLIVPVERIR